MIIPTGREYSVQDQREELLMKACKVGAARELWEETKIDIRKDLDRLEPAILRNTEDPANDEEHEHGGDEEDDATTTTTTILSNEYKHRLFFFLLVDDDDFPGEGDAVPMGIGKDLKVRRRSSAT
jgi:8-oxo-dGTP pyrophosphatase MutT (NUDIX family)